MIEKAGGGMKIRISARKAIGLIVVILGLCVAAYPMYTDYRAQQAQKDLLKQLEEQNPVMEGPIKGSADTGGKVSEKTPMMLIEIPKLAIRAAVSGGTSYADLKTGPGWYPQSALPGQGNTAIAGHRTMYGAWFHDLHKLQEGDTIFLDYQGNLYTYKVERVFVVANNDWSVIDPTEKPSLTLTTCNPIGSAKQRLVARGVLVQKWNEQ